MGVRVTNLTAARISLSDPLTYIMVAREVKIFEFVEYDAVINTPTLARLVDLKYIVVDNLDVSGGVYGSVWNSLAKFHLGNYHLWVDAVGRLRIKNGDATFDFDGTEVGAGVVGPHGVTHTILGADPIPNLETLEDLFICTVAEQVLDLVYESVSDTCAQSNASGIVTMPAIGVVIAKPSPVQALIARAGEVTGFVGLVPDAPYFADTSNGGISLTPPVGSNQVVQKIGYAKNATTLVVQIEEYIIRA